MPLAQASTVPARQPRLLEIDALRGLAAMLVVLYHFTVGYGAEFGWPGSPPSLMFSSAQIGVSIFFVISGFVIAMTLERSKTVSDFALSRFARLYPPFWTCALMTTALIAVTGFNPFHLTASGFLATLTMANGLIDQPFVDPSYWTLTRELLFYAFMAAAFYGAGSRRLTAIILGWVLATSAYNVLVMDQNVYGCRSGASCGAILLNATFAYLFAAGAMLHRLHAGDRSALVKITLVTAILAGSVSFWPVQGFQPMFAVKAALYVGLVGIAASGRVRILRNRPMIFLGAISYSLYLLHQVIGVYVISVLVERGVHANVAIVLALTVVLTLAAAVCFGVERPAQRAIRRFYAERRDGSEPQPPEAPIVPAVQGARLL
ncbi:acyltransferase family protein [Methylobacterium gnaphalii]|uniref:Acyltransferase n=1 Tax=Methylobacterium gnaphalii TaxID=1010610 RepID=A0A512JL02_9HYPH|nr:acyltransferase [Methylobacterium gnaphalii]GEP10572.1 acyltransferase [Methylobacterium gnaphalii]GJD69202.1 hypothetical protein MMMDOFMJ_2129 [Methylobacterium gnaphalii]GLS47864.1 acyltransferase [Methylobacterium gnaphalii]